MQKFLSGGFILEGKNDFTVAERKMETEGIDKRKRLV